MTAWPPCRCRPAALLSARCVLLYILCLPLVCLLLPLPRVADSIRCRGRLHQATVSLPLPRLVVGHFGAGEGFVRQPAAGRQRQRRRHRRGAARVRSQPLSDICFAPWLRFWAHELLLLAAWCARACSMCISSLSSRVIADFASVSPAVQHGDGDAAVVARGQLHVPAASLDPGIAHQPAHCVDRVQFFCAV